MKFSMMVSSGLLVLVGAVMLVEAGYGMGSGASSSGYSSYNPMVAYGSGAYGSGMSGHGCSGYNCGAVAAPAPAKKSYGAYVRPVVYGGRGMYSYKGYARHPAGPKKHSRYARSCSGYNCGSSGYRKQSAGGYMRQAPIRPAYMAKPISYQTYAAPKPSSYGAGYASARSVQYSDAPTRGYSAY